MLGHRRQSLDLKPLPPPPPTMFEEKVESGYPRNTAPDRKETYGLFKKLASKLKSPAAAQLNATPTRTATKVTRVKNAPPLTNDFTCKEQREAALRARGLIAAPKKDLSEVEQDLDQRYAKTKAVPQEQTIKDGQPSAAEKIMQEWKAKNIASGGC